MITAIIIYLISYITLEYLYKKNYEDYLIRELLEDLTLEWRFNTFVCLVYYILVPYLTIVFICLIYLKNTEK
jgi:hypothetical protein